MASSTSTSTSTTTTPKEVEILILGAGWTSQFLFPDLSSHKITYAATTRDGRNNTIKFTFDPSSPSDHEPYTHLPRAKTVLVTFPLKDPSHVKLLVETYKSTHAAMLSNWIALGSTGIFTQPGWNDRDSPVDVSKPAVKVEEMWMEVGGCVLNLAGLYGEDRRPRRWVAKVAPTKEKLREKGSLHLVHGRDVSRAVEVVHKRFTAGERWIVTDGHVYDWWTLVWEWGWNEGDKEGWGRYRVWVQELMREEGVRALPRGPERLGRCLDSRAFWEEMKTRPTVGHVLVEQDRMDAEDEADDMASY